ncbi:hypothetical protein TRAPUB_7269 [Trametes pubescens]|uniref:Uncharacterized protein n=1 Tax=Trametes pubescens TaxID=154538 RepID=A0A1M2V3R8_TRAPU|nr:hypothetical protein TRAPUB_7269 [Trametes pubescens]
MEGDIANALETSRSAYEAGQPTSKRAKLCTRRMITFQYVVISDGEVCRAKLYCEPQPLQPGFLILGGLAELPAMIQEGI